MDNGYEYPSKWRLSGFILALITILAGSLFYADKLFEESEELILNL